MDYLNKKLNNQNLRRQISRKKKALCKEYANLLNKKKESANFTAPTSFHSKKSSEHNDHSNFNIHNNIIAEDSYLNEENFFFNNIEDEREDDFLDESKEKLLANKLKKIFITNNVSRIVSEQLLNALRDFGIELPKTLKGLLKSQHNKKSVIRKIDNGEYLHIGIENNTIHCNVKEIIESSEIKIDIGIDGLPLYKSSMMGIWPILGSYSDHPKIYPFIIGIFLGVGHPKSSDEFLKDFCNEVALLNKNGVQVSKTRLIKKFCIRLFSCDSPAKAFITNTKHHNALNGCHKCEQIGKRINNRTVYNSTSSTYRTDDSFKKKTDKSYHQIASLNNSTALEQIGIKMVTQFILDGMHLIDLGIVKKLLSLVFTFNKNIKNIMSEEYIAMAQYIPKEFSRKPRSFDELPRFKATEFRLFVLYTGIILLKEFFNDDMYEHFLNLSCAVRILSSKSQCQAFAEQADFMMKTFVENFSSFYGEQHLSYNVHNLLHITQCVKNFGFLQSFSCYKFENYMQDLKRKIKKPTNILAQIYNRVQDSWSIEEDLTEVPDFTSFYFDKGEKDSFFLINSIPYKIFNIFTKNDSQFVSCKRFLNIESFFTKPLDSLKAFGIMSVDCLSDTEEIFKITDINYKFMALPYNQKYILIPILHLE